MDEQKQKPLEEEDIHSLYPQALSSVYVLVSGGQLSPEQILRLGVFFAEVSKLLQAIDKSESGHYRVE